jgi:hypothetical protein
LKQNMIKPTGAMCSVPVHGSIRPSTWKWRSFSTLYPTLGRHLRPLGKEFYRPRLEVCEWEKNSTIRGTSHTLCLAQEVWNIQGKKGERSHWMKWTTLRQFPARQLVNSSTVMEVHPSVVTLRYSLCSVNRLELLLWTQKQI